MGVLLDMRSILLLVVAFLVVQSLQKCSNPKGDDSEQITEGCLQRTCKEGVWRTSLAESLCCYERRLYTINTTISSIMSRDGCVRAAIDCVEDIPGHANLIHSMRNSCEEEQNIAEDCPVGYFGEPCKCFEDNIRYFQNNIVKGVNNHQTSQAACRDSCRGTSDCYFWSWVKSGATSGQCFLKNASARENFIPSYKYVSGSRQCILPEDPVLFINMYHIVELPSFKFLPNCMVKNTNWNWRNLFGLEFPVTDVVDGKLTVCGGEHPNDRINPTGIVFEAVCYTLSEGIWVEGVTPRMLKIRPGAASSWTQKGLFVTGGRYTEDLIHSSTEHLTVGGGWEYGPRLPHNLASHCQVSAGSDVYILGGYNGTHKEPMSSVYRLSEGEDNWRLVTNMEYARTDHACVVHDNYIYVLGGTRGEKLDLSTLTWESLPVLPYEFFVGQAFFFQSTLYLIYTPEKQFEVLKVKLTKDNQWEITDLGIIQGSPVFPAPLLTPDILGC